RSESLREAAGTILQASSLERSEDRGHGLTDALLACRGDRLLLPLRERRCLVVDRLDQGPRLVREPGGLLRRAGGPVELGDRRVHLVSDEGAELGIEPFGADDVALQRTQAIAGGRARRQRGGGGARPARTRRRP